VKRIETKRPSVLGRPSRRSNPAGRATDANFTPLIEAEIISRAEIRGARDGFPYLRDVVLVLFSLYGNGKMSDGLGRSMKRMIVDWANRDPAQGKRKVVKRNFKLRRKIYEKALARWENDAPPQARTATAMAAFMLESYGEGSFELALRQTDEG